MIRLVSSIQTMIRRIIGLIRKPVVRAVAGVTIPVMLLILVDLSVHARGVPSDDEPVDAIEIAAVVVDAPSPTTPLLHERARVVQRGETLLELLREHNLSFDEAVAASRAVGTYYDPRRLRPGQELVFRFWDSDLDSVAVRLSAERSIEVSRADDGSFVAADVYRPLTPIPALRTGRITGSLYGAGVSAGLDANLLATLIQLFSFDVDFQRDIHPGNSFSVLFEEYYDEDGNWVRNGSLLSAELVLNHRTLRLFRHYGENGVDFYDPTGRTVRKTLLRTPIEGARLTSGFGRRTHPILGFSHLHPGLDFAAPIGTPINAAGDGTVEAVRNTSGFGIHVILRHANGFRTLYAHMSSTARGIRPGVRVNQGQVIGFVGMTGLTTGPHLHYEVHLNGAPINPATIQFPPERTLRGEELERFQQNRAHLESLLLGPQPRNEA